MTKVTDKDDTEAATGRTKQKTRPFVCEWREAVRDSDLPPHVQFVLLMLATWMDDRGLCWPSIETIAQAMGRDKSSVSRALKIAAERGWVHRQKGRSSTTYQARMGTAAPLHPCSHEQQSTAAPMQPHRCTHAVPTAAPMQYEQPKEQPKEQPSPPLPSVDDADDDGWGRDEPDPKTPEQALRTWPELTHEEAQRVEQGIRDLRTARWPDEGIAWLLTHHRDGVRRPAKLLLHRIGAARRQTPMQAWIALGGGRAGGAAVPPWAWESTENGAVSL